MTNWRFVHVAAVLLLASTFVAAGCGNDPGKPGPGGSLPNDPTLINAGNNPGANGNKPDAPDILRVPKDAEWQTASFRQGAALKLVRVLSDYNFWNSGAVSALVLSSDSQWLLSGDKDGMVRIWDSNSGAEALVIPAEKERGYLMDAVFSTDSARVLLGYSSGIIAEWQVAPAKQINQIRTEENSSVTAVSYLGTTGERIGAICSDAVYEWNAARRRVVRQIDKLSRIARFSVNGNTAVLYQAAKREVWIVDTSNWSLKAAFVTGDNAVTAVEASLDGRLAVVAHSTTATSAQLTIFDSERKQVRAEPRTGALPVANLGVGRDGFTLWTAWPDGTLARYSIDSGREYPPLPMKLPDATALLSTPEGRLIIGARTGTIQAVDGGSGQMLLPKGLSTRASALAMSQDGTHVAVATQNNVLVWSVADGKVQVRLSLGADIIERGVALSADGSRVLAASASEILVYSIPGSRDLFRDKLDSADRRFNSAALSPDGRLVLAAVGGKDPVCIVYDAPAAQKIQQFKPSYAELDIERVAFSPGGAKGIYIHREPRRATAPLGWALGLKAKDIFPAALQDRLEERGQNIMWVGEMTDAARKALLATPLAAPWLEDSARSMYETTDRTMARYLEAQRLWQEAIAKLAADAPRAAKDAFAGYRGNVFDAQTFKIVRTFEIRDVPAEMLLDDDGACRTLAPNKDNANEWQAFDISRDAKKPTGSVSADGNAAPVMFSLDGTGVFAGSLAHRLSVFEAGNGQLRGAAEMGRGANVDKLIQAAYDRPALMASGLSGAGADRRTRHLAVVTARNAVLVFAVSPPQPQTQGK